MLTYENIGYSGSSAGEALAEALKPAIVKSKGHADTHILVKDIHKNEKGWKASVSTVVEPKAPLEIHPVKTKHNKTRETAEPAPRHEPEDEEEKKKKKEKEEEYKHQMEALHDRIEEHEKEYYKLEHEIDEEFVHLYMDVVHQETFEEIAPEFKFSSVHYLTGAMFEEAARHFPDIDFYRAAHFANENKPAPKGIWPFSKQKRQHQLSRDLEND